MSERDDQSVYGETGLAGGRLLTGLSGLVGSVSDLPGFGLGLNCAAPGLVCFFAAFGLVLEASGLVFVDSGLGAGLTKSGLRGTGPICIWRMASWDRRPITSSQGTEICTEFDILFSLLSCSVLLVLEEINYFHSNTLINIINTFITINNIVQFYKFTHIIGTYMEICNLYSYVNIIFAIYIHM